ncbi:MAG: DUF4249 family protein, partial [Bacteroidota bacterium]
MLCTLICRFLCSVIFWLHSVHHVYQCDTNVLKIKKGEKYYLRILLDNNQILTAQCQIPDIDVPEYTVTITPKADRTFDYHVVIKNTKHIDAYCLLQLMHPYPDWSSPDTLYQQLDYQPIFLNHNQSEIEINGTYTVDWGEWVFWGDGFPDFQFTTKLAVCDKNTYLYHQMLPRWITTRDIENPPQVFFQFNINGGLGIFGGYIMK